MSHTPVPVPTEGRERHVLVLGTGGTIASERTAAGFMPMNEKKARDAFYRRIARHPQLSDADVCNHSFEEIHATKVGRNMRYPPLRTPALDEHGNVVVYEILDLENHMDSSEMTPKGKSTDAAGDAKTMAIGGCRC